MIILQGPPRSQFETGMLSFTIYYLIKNPPVLARLREEVDSVLGDRPIKLEDFPKLPYLEGELDM
jgi:cytochrome P450 / NADPH-cytochrome P450 reductase